MFAPAGAVDAVDAVDFGAADLGVPTPAPAQVFGIGLRHAGKVAIYGFRPPRI